MRRPSGIATSALTTRDTKDIDEYEELEEEAKLGCMVMATPTARRPFPHEKPKREPCDEPIPGRPPYRRRARSAAVHVSYAQLVWLMLVLAVSRAQAVFVPFDNCLPPDILNSDPLQLQFVPIFLDATFNTTDVAHHLVLTVHGNVTGQATEGPYPPPDDPSWSDPKSGFGKIVNVSETFNHITTLYAEAQVLSYQAWDDESTIFCDAVVNGKCPVAPVFDGDPDDPSSLASFRVTHDYWGAYSFSTIAHTVRIESGDEGAPLIACVSANVTPDLGPSISNALAYLPAICLVLSAAASIFAAVYSPWGSSDPFKWTSNYGRDEDLLRLVTPGFGDCLQYIQFVVLAGSLSLSYPGFYQPVISKAGWSTLLFNQSYVSETPPSPGIVDGMYVADGPYGLDRLGQLVGFGKDFDMWPEMTITLLGIVAAVALLCQLAFAARWSLRQISKVSEEDLRSKNFPFTGGHIVRIVMNFFLLPVVSLSMFQLVIAPDSPASVVAGAVIFLIITILLAGWICRFILNARPRAHLFDDLPTVLLYGPLYNTYSDDAASFAIVGVLLAFVRGVAFGAIQPSGVAQIVVLVICEIVLMLTLHAFRPFVAPTSMNIYHICLSITRLVTTLLMVAFVPALGVSETSKGWVGYVLLLIHAIVLIFAFLLNALQKIIEVVARLAGAGETRGGLAKVFGKRDLSRRHRRRTLRESRGSTAAMLGPDTDAKSIQMMGGRSRSLSASSAVLLNQQRASSGLGSTGFDGFSQMGDFSGPGTPGGAPSAFSFNPSGASAGPGSRRATFGSRITDTNDPYYRPPRPRKPVVDTNTPASRSRGSGSLASGDWGARPYQDSPTPADAQDAGEGPSTSSPGNRGSGPPQPYLRNLVDDSDASLDQAGKRTDYTVRESDFYYGISRGPALSDMPTRRLRTGPADPMGPASAAAGWIRTLFGGKRKDKGKGFEVVRSTRAPPQMIPLEDDESLPTHHEPYQDSPDPENPEAIGLGVVQESHEGQDITTANREVQPESASDGETGSSELSDADSDDYDAENSFHFDTQLPPMLAPIEAAGAIELPSRYGSQTSRLTDAREDRSHRSSRRGRNDGADPHRAPTIPRKSSRRKSTEPADLLGGPRLSTVSGSPSNSPSRSPARSVSTGLSAGHATSIPPPPGLPRTSSSSNRIPPQDPHLLHPSTSNPLRYHPELQPSAHRLPFEGSYDPSPSPEERPSPSVASANSFGSSLYPAGEGLVDQHRQPGTGPTGIGRGALAGLPTGQAAVSVASGAAPGSTSSVNVIDGPSISESESPAAVAARARAGTGASDRSSLRPASVGYVHHHVAGDRIIQPGAVHGPASNLGASAEVVRSRSGSSAGTGRSEAPGGRG